MTGPGLLPLLAEIAAALIAGLAFGGAYFAALNRTVSTFVAGTGRLVPIALTFARIAAAGVFFAFAASFGIAPLLASFLGFLAARGVAVRAANGAA
jgi:hypothetical protein